MSRVFRVTWAGAVALLTTVVLFGCGDDGEGGNGPLPAPTATSTAPPLPTPTATPRSAFVDEAWFRERQLDYLRFATGSLSAGNLVNVIAHLERKRVDPGFTVPDGAVAADAWDRIFAKLARLADTRDFDALDLLYILHVYRDDPMLAPGLADKVEQALTSFKFWYVDPTPEGLRDDTWYWTENHQILFFTIEYLMGQLYPDRVMGTDGRTGRAHLERARAHLLRWIDLRARFGFSEWHSNVYYQEDFNGLLTLVELAEDEDIRTRAAMTLDLLLFDMALHTQRGAFGVTHGRSYKKDKMTSLHDDTWGAVKFLFDRSEYPYQSTAHGDATLLARARRYRMPELIRRLAVTEQAYVDRERIGIRLDEKAPLEPNPVAPYGFSYTDPNDVVVWWGMSALTAWQVVPLTLATIEQYNFWDSELFQPFSQLRILVPNPTGAQQLARATAAFSSFGNLVEVNSYTYRTADYMLSSAVDYRKGSRASQAHAWQLTFDPNALLFTNHPCEPIVESTNWRDDTESTGGYWTGEGAFPRSAQHENVAIHIYAPQYSPENPPPLDIFSYEPYTHAYVPQDHFDEVVQEGPWTFVRFRDGYGALYSYRSTEWIAYDPTRYATNGMVKPFDLRANGGPDNVWIVEAGTKSDWGSFEAFRAAVVASAVRVTPRALQGQFSAGFDVEYESPSQGLITFGWEAPLTVAGSERPLFHERRFDNPWSQSAFNQRVLSWSDGVYRVELDFEAGVRTVEVGEGG